MKTARRQAREIALQALYAWQLSGDDPLEQARSIEGFDKTDARSRSQAIMRIVENDAFIRRRPA